MVLRSRVRCRALLLIVVVIPSLRADELIFNGDFELGNKGFQSEFSHSPDTILDAPSYAIVKNPSAAHRDADSFHDRSGNGFMLVFNANGGRNDKDIVWAQTADVAPRNEYVFSLWVAQWYALGEARLDVRINGKSVGNARSSGKAGAWQEFRVKWNSGNEKSAALEIVNQTRSNLAIDDISLQGGSGLPNDVVDRIGEFEADADAIRKKAGAQIRARRNQLIRDLQVLQDTYTRAGKLDEAVAIRSRIQQLKAEDQAIFEE